MVKLVIFQPLSNRDLSPLGGVLLSAVSNLGNWAKFSNACGDCIVSLSPGFYSVTFSKAGFADRVLPVTINPPLNDTDSDAPIRVGLEPSVPVPGVLPTPPPTREQVCAVRIGFQGETVTTQEYGTFPCFGPETTTLNDADLHSYCAQLAGKGWTHGEIAVSWQYAQPGFLMPVPGRDLSNDLPELARRLVIMLQYFQSVVIFCAGDGRSKPKNPDGSYPYNDPVGHTYGHEWLMDNFPRIGRYFQSGNPYGDLTKYCSFSPGYDGVFYGWGNTGEPDLQPHRVIDFGKLFRLVLPNGYLAIEHTPGNIPVGGSAGDWTRNGPMSTYDILLSEYNNWPQVSGDYWQTVARCVGPAYKTPPDQAAAAADPSNPNHGAAVDPNPPYYLKEGNPRGPYFYVAFEYATYLWTRGRISAADVQTARNYFTAMGVRYVC